MRERAKWAGVSGGGGAFAVVLFLFGVCGCVGAKTQHAEIAQARRQPSASGSVAENRIFLGIKYVAYNDKQGRPAVTRTEAESNLQQMNKLYGQCGIEFRLDSYQAVDPSEFGLRYNTANYRELDEIREAFGDESSLLIVTTGPWDRSGSLGKTNANAWTAMPGGGPYGAILEKSVGTFSNIIAHELGHYLNLFHVSDKSDLMNPIIYKTSTRLSHNQCETMREAATVHWAKVNRDGLIG